MILTILSSQLILATLTQAAIFFDPTAKVHSCVNSDGTTLTPSVPVHLTDIDTTFDEQTILLKPITPNTTIVSASDGVTHMCVFHRWTKPIEDKAAGKGFYFPLGRSVPTVPAEVYANYTGSIGDWTRYPGRSYAQTEYICGEAGNSGTNFVEGEYLCEVTLPSTSKQNAKDPVIMDHNDAPYFLTYYERQMSIRNELSRFLQKNTFGPTEADLDALEAAFMVLKGEDVADVVDANTTSADNTTDVTTTPATEAPAVTNTTRRHRVLQNVTGNATDLTGNATESTTDPEASTDTTLTDAEALFQLQLNWVLSQMDPTTFSTGEFTSLRKYYRRRLNPRKEETYRIGESGPHPCETNSRWRKFAFTNFDVQNSMSLRWGNQDLGGAYQTQKGHRVHVTALEYWGPVVEEEGEYDGNVTEALSNVTMVPTGFPSLSGPPSLSLSPTNGPIPNPGTPTMSPTLSLMPSFSSAPTFANILAYGDMEGTERSVFNQWLPSNSKCKRTLIDAATSPDLV
ncbi:hypothetical protein ACHAXR_004127, partial [Thalassiosira sp. AJA248-18]